jgi:DNA-directed RNA polymerase specialized sigma24 family protein
MFIQEVFVFFCVYTCRVEPMNLATEDAILASQCAEGNEMARERLYKEYAARVYMLCVRYMGDGDLAKDLMQDCFIRVFENI